MCQYDQIYEYKARRSSIWSLPNMPSFNYQTNWGFSFSIQHICLPTFNFSKTLSNIYNSVFFICQQRCLLRVRKLSIKWYFHSDSTHLFSHSTFLPKTKWMYFSIVLSQYTVHQGQEFRYLKFQYRCPMYLVTNCMTNILVTELGDRFVTQYSESANLVNHQMTLIF